MSSIIEVENITKSYTIGKKESYGSLRDEIMQAITSPFRRRSAENSEDNTIWALKDVSFEVKEGEVLGIIGRNGAGKSTLLKILSRITEPTTGRITMRGRVASLLEVGTGFHPELTGRENILLNGALLGMTRQEIKSKFDEIVAFAEIEKFMDTPVKRYSSGMYVRLAFAVAAHLEPEILIVDEVLAVGDASFQKKCLGKMGEVAKGGRTVLFVSHNMGVVKQLCQRTILLNKGIIESVGQTGDVVSSYLSGERGSNKTECFWNENDPDAPGDETARMRSIRLCTESGESRSVFGTDEPVYVEIGYAIFKKLSPFRIGFSLHSSDDTYMFYSADDDMPEYAGKARNPGVYLSRCAIPSNWLNAGNYYLGISGGIFGERIIFKGLPMLDFSVSSVGGATSRFGEKRRGVLCPDLDWKIIENKKAG
jgi:lipopolysaccharide transport system ATP-binding protein